MLGGAQGRDCDFSVRVDGCADVDQIDVVRASSRGGSSRPARAVAARRRAVSVRSSMKALTSAAAAPAPAPVASRYRVPRSVRNRVGSKVSASLGVTACRTLGSARAAKATATPCQMESRVRGSAVVMASSASAQPSVAVLAVWRMRTARRRGRG